MTTYRQDTEQEERAKEGKEEAAAAAAAAKARWLTQEGLST